MLLERWNIDGSSYSMVKASIISKISNSNSLVMIYLNFSFSSLLLF